MGNNFVFGIFSHTKSGSTNNNRTDSSDISYKSPFSCNSNGNEKFTTTGMKFYGFSSNFDQIK